MTNGINIGSIKELIGGRCIELSVDGGVNANNASSIVEAGADVLVAGSAVFGEKNYGSAISALRDVGE